MILRGFAALAFVTVEPSAGGAWGSRRMPLMHRENEQLRARLRIWSSAKEMKQDPAPRPSLPNGQRNVLLPDGREERREVHQPVYPVCHHDLLQALEIQDVGEHVGTCRAKEPMTHLLKCDWMIMRRS